MQFLLKCANNHEVKVKDLPVFCAIANDFLHEFAKDGLLERVYDPDCQQIDVDGLFADYPTQWALLSNMLGFDEIDPLACVLENRAIFSRLRQGSKQNSVGSEQSFANSFQRLISHGHNHNDILNYPVSVFFEYVHACNNQTKAELSLERFAHLASNKQFTDFLKD